MRVEESVLTALGVVTGERAAGLGCVDLSKEEGALTLCREARDVTVSGLRD